MKIRTIMILAAFIVAAAALAGDGAKKPKKPRVPFPKPSRGELAARQSDDSALLKFTDGTAIRLRGNNFVVLDSDLELDRAGRQGVTRSKLDVQLATLNDLLHHSGVSIAPLLTTPEDVLREQRRTGEEKGEQELADLNLFFDLRFPGKAAPYIVNVLDMLNQLEVVEFAAPKIKLAPPPADIPPTTPSFTANQTYFAPAPNGIDVQYARPLSGGRGESLRVVDVETAWVVDHEDAPTYVSTSGVNYFPFRYHGAAVSGEIAGVENAYGMTGIAPAVEFSIASPNTAGDIYNLPDGVQRAYNQSRIGDIILIEQQVYYNYPSDQSFCPPEWDPAVFSIVQTAVANGRIVVETAGNGTQNLDDSARFGTRFNRNVQDTGSIYVGAGRSSVPHSPLGFSNFGSRLDAQGWGENIYTLGYGDLFFPSSDDRQSYTAFFGGTSGAAPMVTGAAAIIQGVRRGRALPDLTSQQMRAAVVVGATPQGGGVAIGPLPNLHTAVAAIPLASPTITAIGSANGSVTVSWNAVPGVNGYDVFRKDSQSSTWIQVDATSATQSTNAGLTAGRTYLYLVRAHDAAGDSSPDSNYELATTIDYTDPQLSTATLVRAKHIVDVRTAANAICTFAGTTICPSLPFTGAALDETQVKTQLIRATDFTAVQNQIVSLRSGIGASAATFRETPALQMPVRFIHMEDLRTGAN